MPLLDHFRPPLIGDRHWESFHSLWAGSIVRSLNRRSLPQGYFAEAEVHVGTHIEADVATFERDESSVSPSGNGGVAVETIAPPTITLDMPAVFPDVIEVQVYGPETGKRLVAAIELVSPANKDRLEFRRAFAIKCASYLQAGLGLLVIDTVTDRLFNLHDELIRLIDLPHDYFFASSPATYTVAYRHRRVKKVGDKADVWMVPLALGQPLPVMPLALRGGPVIAIDLESTYSEARLDSRL